MISDLISWWINFVAQVVALLFVLRFVQGLNNAKVLQLVLRPFKPWMDPLVIWMQGRIRRHPGKPDYSPIILAFLSLIFSSLLDMLF